MAKILFTPWAATISPNERLAFSAASRACRLVHEGGMAPSIVMSAADSVADPMRLFVSGTALNFGPLAVGSLAGYNLRVGGRFFVSNLGIRTCPRKWAGDLSAELTFFAAIAREEAVIDGTAREHHAPAY